MELSLDKSRKGKKRQKKAWNAVEKYRCDQPRILVVINRSKEGDKVEYCKHIKIAVSDPHETLKVNKQIFRDGLGLILLH